MRPSRQIRFISMFLNLYCCYIRMSEEMCKIQECPSFMILRLFKMLIWVNREKKPLSLHLSMLFWRIISHTYHYGVNHSVRNEHILYTSSFHKFFHLYSVHNKKEKKRKTIKNIYLMDFLSCLHKYSFTSYMLMWYD